MKCAGVLLFLASVVAAQTPNVSRAVSLEEELAYVRGLVDELRFVELAEHELRALRARFPQETMRFAPELLAAAAQVAVPWSERARLYRRALRAWREVPRAHDEFVETSLVFAAALRDQVLWARTWNRPHVLEHEREAVRVLREAVAVARTRRCLVQRLRHGILLRILIEVDGRTPDEHVAAASSHFEDVILELPCDGVSILEWRAQFEYARVQEACGQLREAGQSYREGLDGMRDLVHSRDVELSPSARRVATALLEMHFVRLAHVRAELGQWERVAALEREFRAAVRRPDLFHADTFFVLGVAAMCREPSSIGEVIDRVCRVSARHPDDAAGACARLWLSIWMRRFPQLDRATVRMQFARDHVRRGCDEGAVRELKRALALDARNVRAWELLARCLDRLGRTLEAVFACLRAIERCARHSPEQHRIAEVAAGYMDRVLRTSRHHAAFGDLTKRIDSFRH